MLAPSAALDAAPYLGAVEVFVAPAGGVQPRTEPVPQLIEIHLIGGGIGQHPVDGGFTALLPADPLGLFGRGALCMA
ncbi:hypothetical protein A5671_16775 [Mycolicibacter heraklionensis]|nr:hypothetical protein A5671_16775 [Mycolicibacter heraklionensis]